VNHIKRALGKSADKNKIKKYKSGTYINCDVRYFNFSSLGDFDVVLIDPPWRVMGGQRHGDSANMFSNSKFNFLI
jgi:16S rRNA G966 N2-methylase RsmD